MNELNIELSINGSKKLIAIDNTSYDNLIDSYDSKLSFFRDMTNHASVEFLVDSKSRVVKHSEIINDSISPFDLNNNMSEFDLPVDGTYIYYKFLVPRLSHMVKNDPKYNEEVFYVSNQMFYHNGDFYYCNHDEDVYLRDYISIESAIEYILSKSFLLNLDELWAHQGSQTLSFQKSLFSVCNLQKCLVSLQRQILNSSCNNCDQMKDVKLRRDFILSSLYVLDFLKDSNNFEEAQRILDNLESCSNSMCGNNSENSCGCEKLVF